MNGGESYLRLVETVAQVREHCVRELSVGEMTNEHLHAVRGKIVVCDHILAVMGGDEAKAALRKYNR